MRRKACAPPCALRKGGGDRCTRRIPWGILLSPRPGAARPISGWEWLPGAAFPCRARSCKSRKNWGRCLSPPFMTPFLLAEPVAVLGRKRGNLIRIHVIVGHYRAHRVHVLVALLGHPQKYLRLLGNVRVYFLLCQPSVKREGGGKRHHLAHFRHLVRLYVPAVQHVHVAAFLHFRELERAAHFEAPVAELHHY